MMKRDSGRILILFGAVLALAPAIAPIAAWAGPGSVRADLLIPGLVYAPKEPITIRLTLENIGGNPVTLPERCFAGEAFNLVHTVEREPMKPGRIRKEGPVELEPRGQHAREVRLDKVFKKLKRQGRYELQWSCDSWRSFREVFVVAEPYDPERDRVAVITTNHGEMVFGLMPDVAPKHVETFARLARQGYYDGIPFRQLIPGIQIETGGAPILSDRGWRHQIPPEIQRDLVPLRGMIGALRRPNSRSTMTSASEFFILLETNPGFQGFHTFYASLEKGEDVLAAIGSVPVSGGKGLDPFRPLEPVRVESIRIRPE